jgi:hypothetical protein
MEAIIPTLKRNDIVVLDNLGSHRGKAVRQAITDISRLSISLQMRSDGSVQDSHWPLAQRKVNQSG